MLIIDTFLERENEGRRRGEAGETRWKVLRNKYAEEVGRQG